MLATMKLEPLKSHNAPLALKKILNTFLYIRDTKTGRQKQYGAGRYVIAT